MDIVRESLLRYQAALNNEGEPLASIADENSQFITTEEQRKLELERTETLLRKLPKQRTS